MMRAKRVIASNIGGLGEVDDCGLRVPSDDQEALTECMRTVLDHPEIAEQLGEAAKNRAKPFFRAEDGERPRDAMNRLRKWRIFAKVNGDDLIRDRSYLGWRSEMNVSATQ
jgi:glycosyltransferase involved in cell wall biosynthesis